jgi:uncharacterized protein (TIRG00374 family)
MSKAVLPPKTRNDFWRILPGILISLTALGLIFYFIDWQSFLEALKRANYSFFLIALPVYLVSFTFRALAWYTLLKEEVSFKKIFLTMNAGYLLNNVLPFRVGELGRAFLLGRTGLGFWRVFSTILIERAFDMILAAGLLLGTIPFVAEVPGDWQVGAVVGGLVGVGLVIFYLFASNREKILVWFDKLGKRWPRLTGTVRDRLQAFLAGLSALTDLYRFVRVLCWMAISWALALVYYFMLLLAFVPGAKFLWSSFGLATTALGVAVPSSPGYVGVYEAAWVGALALFGISFSAALAFALVSHFTQIVVTGIFGVYALAQEGETLGNLFKKIRERPSN